ncbi:hypothetical protein LMG29660_05379 [Burkholderia puraquae]|nr:hypothetical protein LMG29660_05379 [Burkholderia puraquae]
METMGAEFGDNLMPAVEGVNDKGFFEDLDVNAINQEILSLAGADWHSLAPIEFGKIDEASLQAIRERATALLSKKCGSKTFALKDPRISRLLPFWQPIFYSLDVRVVYVLAIRNPMSVGRSLEKRDGFSHDKSLLLWLMHTISALDHTKGMQRVLVDYDKLMEAPRVELARMSVRLELPLDGSRVAAFEDEFLDGGLRHSKFKSGDLSKVNSAERHVKALFGALESASELDDPEFERRVLPIIEQAWLYLEALAPILQLEWGLEQEVTRLNAEVSGCRDEGAALQRQIEEQASELNDWRARTESAIAIGEELRTKLEIAMKEQAALAESLATYETTSEMQHVALGRAERAVAEMLGSRSWRITKPLRFFGRLASSRK